MLQFFNKGISTPLAIGIILLAAVLVGGIFVWQYRQYQMPREELELLPEEEGVEEQKLAEEAVKGYEDALKTRKRDKVLPYTTGEIKKEVQKWPPVYGTANPHPGGSKILSSKKISDSEFEVKARHFEEYTGEGIIGYSDNTYTVEKIGDEYLVASIKYGKYVETAKEKLYIKVISPNGGEEWTIGDIHEIEWECSRYSKKWSELGIDIWLIGKHLKDGPIKIASFPSGKAGVHEYSWTVPSTVEPAMDSFKIKIERSDGEVEDKSDNYFSIIRASEGTTDWKTYRNEEYGFEVQYPAYSPVEEGSDEWIVEIPIVEIPINKKITTSPCYEAYIKK